MCGGEVGGSAQSGDGRLDGAAQLLSRPGPDEMLPSPGGEEVAACLSGISWDPFHCAALLRRATGNQLCTQQC